MEAYVARQPIFTVNKNVYGYELLFRDGLTNYMPDIDGDEATSKVLSNSFLTIGLENITAGKKAFINFTQNLIENELPLVFPKDLTVVEILESVKGSDALLSACSKISSEGYTIALDDFVYHDDIKPLMKIANIVKIDFRITEIDEIEDFVKYFSKYDVKLLAEKVESIDEFNTAKDLGFDYFQGYFFCKPEVLTGKEITSTNLSLLRLISEVHKHNFEFDKLEQIISKDITVSYKLLRYINSAFFRRANEIKSIKQAIVQLGQKELKRFISLIAMTKISAKKPQELVRNSCVKAKFCELLGKISKQQSIMDELFTIGLFSSIDALLDQSMDTVLDKLPFSSEIKNGLLKQDNILASYLSLAKHYELGEWDKVSGLALKLNIPENKITETYILSCKWTDEITAN